MFRRELQGSKQPVRYKKYGTTYKFYGQIVLRRTILDAQLMWRPSSRFAFSLRSHCSSADVGGIVDSFSRQIVTSVDILKNSLRTRVKEKEYEAFSLFRVLACSMFYYWKLLLTTYLHVLTRRGIIYRAWFLYAARPSRQCRLRGAALVNRHGCCNKVVARSVCIESVAVARLQCFRTSRANVELSHRQRWNHCELTWVHHQNIFIEG